MMDSSGGAGNRPVFVTKRLIPSKFVCFGLFWPLRLGPRLA